MFRHRPVSRGLPDNCRVECNRIDGCVSKVWLVEEIDAGSVGELMAVAAREAGEQVVDDGDARCPMYFNADSDAHIVRGLVAVLLAAYSNKSPEDILQVDIRDIFEQLDLQTHLSPSRSNGFFAMVERIRAIATGIDAAQAKA